MNMQQGRTRGLHCIEQSLLNTILVVEAFGLPKINDQVTARKGHSITRNEVVLTILIPFGNRNRDGPQRSAGFISPRAIDRRHSVFESSHPGTYPSKGVDT